MTARTPGHDDAEISAERRVMFPDRAGGRGPVGGAWGPPGGGPEHPTEPFAKITDDMPPPDGMGGAAASRTRPPGAIAADAAGEAGEAGRASAGRVPGMPDASPWQRSHAVWHRAGVDWVHGGEQPEAGESAQPPRPPKVKGPKRRPRPLPVAAVALVLAAAGGAYAVAARDGDERTAAPAAVPADRIFAPDPAAKTDGLVQDFATVAAAGNAVVAIGSETGEAAGRERARFLVSSDGGAGWRLATVRTPDGAEPPPGLLPRRIAGGSAGAGRSGAARDDGGWAALGGPAEGPGTAVWTSKDGGAWTLRPAAGAAFGAGAEVTGLARTSAGFVTVGAAAGKGAVWTSPDGAAWQRIDKIGAGTVISLDRVAASGGTAVASGTYRRSVTKTVKRKGKKRKVTSTRTEPGAWRSTDGGRTWSGVTLPQAQGSYGGVAGLVAGPGGFHAVRAAERETGKGKRKKTERYAVAFFSGDGASWAAAGQIKPAGFAGIDRLAGSPAGLAIAVKLGGGRTAVLRGEDGREWRPAGEVAGGRALTGLAPVPGRTLITSRQGDDAFVSTAGGGDANLAAVPGAVRPQRTIAALAGGPGGRTVAVGGTNGAPAAWSSGDGRAWTRSSLPADVKDGRLGDAVSGPRGWLAVGERRSGPLLMTSPDGAAWRNAPALPGSGAVPLAAAYGPGGYLVVGKSGSSAAAWRSADLKTWTSGKDAGKVDLDGGRWMRDVAAVQGGYVAIGGRMRDDAPQPAAWTSPDGRTWTAVTAPPLPPGLASGRFTRLAARGATAVAIGMAATDRTGARPDQRRPIAAVSTDAGRTWRSLLLPGVAQDTTLTDVATTGRGFALAGTAGPPGSADVVLWGSADGLSWRPAHPAGAGLGGRGDQWLSTLLPAGDGLLAAGATADHRGETPTLWRAAAP